MKTTSKNFQKPNLPGAKNPPASTSDTAAAAEKRAWPAQDLVAQPSRQSAVARGPRQTHDQEEDVLQAGPDTPLSEPWHRQSGDAGDDAAAPLDGAVDASAPVPPPAPEAPLADASPGATTAPSVAGAASSPTSPHASVLASMALSGVGAVASAGAGSKATETASHGEVSPPAAQVMVTGQVTLGPVIAQNRLTVLVLKLNADGSTAPVNGTVDASTASVKDDSTYSLPIGSYRGPVVLRLIDADERADYVSEVGAVLKDVQGDYFSLGRITDNPVTTLNLNALTTLAAQRAGALVAADGTLKTPSGLDASRIAAANQETATAFKLASLSGEVIPTVTQGQQGQSGNDYGKLLAAIEGATQSKADTAQALNEVLSALSAGITPTGNAVLLNSAAQTVLIDGGARANLGSEVMHPLLGITSPEAPADTTAPTLAISSDTAMLSGGQTATLTFTFSEVPVGFTAQDVVSPYGSISQLTVGSDPKVYTATFTPENNFFIDSTQVRVAAGTYSDAAGNAGSQAVSPAIGVDTRAPFSKPVYASSYGVVANSTTDQTALIAQAIEKAAAASEQLIFEKGVYLVSGDIRLPQNFYLTSQSPGETVFKVMPSTAGTPKAIFTAGGWDNLANAVTKGTFSGLVLDGVQFEAYGRATGITVSDNVFLNTVGPLPAHSGYGEAVISQLYLGNGTFKVQGNVFLNEGANATQNVVAMKTYFTQNTTLEGNIVGGINDSALMQTKLSTQTRALLDGIKAYKPSLDVSDAGYFSSGFYFNSGDYNLRFLNNALVLDTSLSVVGDDSKGYFRDHVIYGKEYSDVQILNNYFTGGAPDAAGQVKIRNGQGALVKGNVFDKVSAIFYTYDNAPLRVSQLSNTYVLDNDFIGGEVSYWENATGLALSNFNVVGNRGLTGIDIAPQANAGRLGSFYAANNTDANGQWVVATFKNAQSQSGLLLHRDDWGAYFADPTAYQILPTGTINDLIELSALPVAGQTLNSLGAAPELLKVHDQVLLDLAHPGSTADSLANPSSTSVPLDRMVIDGVGYSITKIQRLTLSTQSALGSGDFSDVVGYLLTARSGSVNKYFIKLDDGVGSVPTLQTIAVKSISSLLNVQRASIDDNYDVSLSKPNLTLAGMLQGAISEDGVVNAAEATRLQAQGTSLLADGTVVSVIFSHGTQKLTRTATVSAGRWVLDDTDITALTDGTITVEAVATDAAGITYRAASQTLTKEAAVIDLASTNTTLTGQLINRIDANGKKYYLYDGNADRVGGAGDALSRTALAALFNENLDGTATGALSDTYRYKTLNAQGGGQVRLALLSFADLAGLQLLQAGKTTSDAGWLYNGAATNMHLAGANLGTSASLGDRWLPSSSTVVDIASTSSSYMTVFEVVNDLRPGITLSGKLQTTVSEDGVVNAAEATLLQVQGSSLLPDGTAVSVIFSNGAQQLTRTANIAAGKWALGSTDISGLADGTIRMEVLATDGQGVTKSASQSVIKDTAVIDLASTNTTLTGQLINRIDANGKKYYLYDGNANGTGGTGDALSRNQLAAVLNENLDGSATGALSDTYRYKTFNTQGGGKVRLGLLSSEDIAQLQSVLAGKTSSDAGWLFNGAATNMHLAGADLGTNPAVGDRWVPSSSTVVDIATATSSYMAVFEVVSVGAVI